MTLYSYIVTHDSGFAPNPFWGWCTLATCKPGIRRKAKIGDWVIGLSPKRKGSKLVYAMRVDEILTIGEYYRDRRFKCKIPDYHKGQFNLRLGDNIYEPLGDDNFRQLRSMHSNEDEEDLKNKRRDLSGINVLLSRRFYYLGREAVELPKGLSILKVGRGHKCKFDDKVIRNFLAFIDSFPTGIHGQQKLWDKNAQCGKKRGKCT